MISDKTYIIAEAGVNHNGSIEMAKHLIDVAAEAGADAVKFQTFKAEKIVSQKAPKAEYQTKTTDSADSQLEMIKKLELNEADHKSLIEHCMMQGIQFLSTPFDLESIDLLAHTFDLPRLKIPSGEITNAPLLLKAARTGKPIILSTGMSLLGEVETALGVLAFGYMQSDDKLSLEAFQKTYCSESGQNTLQKNVVLLHCTTEYPAPFSDVNLKVMDTMRYAFGLPIGYSDHTTGIAIPIAAVARGAVVVEKHFTLNRDLPGPDHKASLEPRELKAMIASIRQVEQALGNSIKFPVQSELKNRSVARKSLVAATDINEGDSLTDINLAAKRHGSGITPIHHWEWVGKAADKTYQKDEAIGTE